MPHKVQQYLFRSYTSEHHETPPHRVSVSRRLNGENDVGNGLESTLHAGRRCEDLARHGLLDRVNDATLMINW